MLRKRPVTIEEEKEVQKVMHNRTREIRDAIFRGG
jgi:hypothetical protein